MISKFKEGKKLLRDREIFKFHGKKPREQKKFLIRVDHKKKYVAMIIAHIEREMRQKNSLIDF